MHYRVRGQRTHTNFAKTQKRLRLLPNLGLDSSIRSKCGNQKLIVAKQNLKYVSTKKT
jgi:protoporphyrinogen oxidase